MHVQPDALRYAAGLIEKEWGCSGYAITHVDGSGPVALVHVIHFDGSRFVICANELTGQWGDADGDDDQAEQLAKWKMERARYAGGQWTWPADPVPAESIARVIREEMTP